MAKATGARHEVLYTKESTFGTTPTAVLRDIATISVDGVTDAYEDDVENLTVFKAGDIIQVSGFTLAANNGKKHVSSVVLGAPTDQIFVEEVITTEVAGDPVTIVIAFPRLRNTGTTLNLNKDSFPSEEIRSDRQMTDLRHGNKRVEGDVSIELGAEDFDLLIEAAMQGAWSTPLTGGVLKAGTTQRSFSVARLFEDVGEMLVFDGVMVNSFAVSAQINAMVTATLGLVGQTGAPPTHIMTVLPGGTVEIGDEFVLSDKDGNELISFTAAAGTVANVVAGLVAAWNLSTNPICELYTAADVATTHMTLTADTPGTWYEIVPTTVEGGGNATETMILTHAPVRPASDGEGNAPFDTFTGVIKEGGGAVTNILGVEFSLDNGLDPAHVLMDAEATQFINGRSNITGTVTAYFEDMTLLNKFINETGSIIEVEFEDPAGNKLNFLFPKVKYMGGELPVTGEDAIILTLPFQALYDGTELTNLKITKTIV